MGIIDMIESSINNNEGYGANVQNTNVYKDSVENSKIISQFIKLKFTKNVLFEIFILVY